MSDRLMEEVAALLRVIRDQLHSAHRRLTIYEASVAKELAAIREDQRMDKFRRAWFAALWAVAGAALAMLTQAFALLRQWWTG